VQTFHIFEQISTFLTVNYPAAAAGPASGSEEPPSGAEVPLGRSLAWREGLPPGHEPFRGGAWLGESCGASNSLKNFPPH